MLKMGNEPLQSFIHYRELELISLSFEAFIDFCYAND